mmetsp:Transcript_442/g.885  ORF Transcript_442/g.885 Transcript_442/m.885 type:complete len:211 (-) Transcript_442:501-1133(-)
MTTAVPPQSGKFQLCSHASSSPGRIFLKTKKAPPVPPEPIRIEPSAVIHRPLSVALPPLKLGFVSCPPISASVYCSCIKMPSAEKPNLPLSSFKTTGLPKNSSTSLARHTPVGRKRKKTAFGAVKGALPSPLTPRRSENSLLVVPTNSQSPNNLGSSRSGGAGESAVTSARRLHAAVSAGHSFVSADSTPNLFSLARMHTTASAADCSAS